MTIPEIKRIALKYGVDPVFLKGATKAELIRKIDSYYDGLYQHAIILRYKNTNYEKEKLDYKTQRDTLRQHLGIVL